MEARHPSNLISGRQTALEILINQRSKLITRVWRFYPLLLVIGYKLFMSKIANIVCAYPPYKGGMGNSAYQFAKILNSHGHEVITFAPHYIKSEKEKKVSRLKPWLKIGNGAFLPQIFFRLKNFDIIYLHYPFFGTAEIVWLFKLIYKKPKLIIHYHMDVVGLPWYLQILSWPSKLIQNSLFKKAEVILCSSLDYIKNSDIKNFYQKYPNKFQKITFGVDTKKFKPEDKEGLGEVKKILFVGGLDKAHYFKGIEVLLKAVSKLKISNYQLQIVGDGDLRPEYEKQTKNLKIQDKVKFLGSVTNERLPEIYSQADVFILPSITKGEAFGLVLLEAMASGTPVIASDLPGVRSVFENNIQGLKIKPGDANDLREKLEKILTDENLRKKMSQSARELALEKYDWGKIRKKLIQIF